MHKLIEYVCDELKELERKADKDGKLSMAEIQYMDTLAHAKKNLLTGDAMMEAEGGESGYYMPMHGRSYGDESMMNNRSYARGRDRMGRYTSRRGSMSYDSGMVDELRDLMEQAPEESKRDFQKLIDKIERM